MVAGFLLQFGSFEEQMICILSFSVTKDGGMIRFRQAWVGMDFALSLFNDISEALEVVDKIAW